MPPPFDRAADPCQDFYQYGCGTWLKTHSSPADRSAWDPYYELAQKHADAVRAILDGGDEGQGEESRKIRDDYASCMEESAIERAGVAPLAAALRRIDAVRTPADSAALAVLHQLGAEALFFLYPFVDFADADRVIAGLDLPVFALPDRDYYLSNEPEKAKLRETYRHHVALMLEYGGLKPTPAAAGADAVLRFEMRLAQASPTKVQRRDPKGRHHALTAAQLGSLTASFRWEAYFRALGVRLPKEVNVDSPEYLQAAAVAWQGLGVEEQKAYLRWLLVDTMESVLPARFVEDNFAFYGRALNGTNELQPRWKCCAKMTNRHLGEAVGRRFIEKRFAADDLERVLAMIRDIQAAFRDDMATLPCMSEATRAEAIRKLDAHRSKVGYPERWRDYSGLESRRGDAFGDAVRTSRFEFARRVAKIGRPVDRDEWFSLPQNVDGYHIGNRVEIVFTAGFLQPPFFDPKRDDAVNLGALGRAIGHEWTHGFDDEGRLFDRHGNLHDEWTPADAAGFAERAQCFVDEYSQFVVVDLKLNGRLTLGENIADNGGMRFAYPAPMKRLGDGPRVAIDGISPKQRLFLAFAQTQCANVSDATLRHRLLTDPHSPGHFRVNGTLANLPEFQKAFGCRAGDAMVSSRPCRIW